MSANEGFILAVDDGLFYVLVDQKKGSCFYMFRIIVAHIKD